MSSYDNVSSFRFVEGDSVTFEDRRVQVRSEIEALQKARLELIKELVFLEVSLIPPPPPFSISFLFLLLLPQLSFSLSFSPPSLLHLEWSESCELCGHS